MGIDKSTKINFLNIVLDDDKKYLDSLRKQADEDGQNEFLDENECKKLSLTLDAHSFNTEEYYYDENDNKIVLTGSIVSNDGKSFFSISIPLSDVLLIDILAASVKRLNKLKSVMESLS